MSQTITREAWTASQSYTYDGVNRLTGFTEAANGSQRYNFDRWGNRWVAPSSTWPLHLATPVQGDYYNTATNRLVKGYGGAALPPDAYDAAGHLTNHPQIGQMQYDGEGRLKQHTAGAAVATYAYDGEGRRVSKTAGGVTTRFVYDAFGQLAAEYGGAAGGGGRKYVNVDHLGSTRVVTNAAGAVTEAYDYFPFGEEMGAGNGGRTTAMGYSPAGGEKLKFTGKERDAETGLDYFLARYYSGAQGRFTSVDPIWITKERMLDPQRLNLYGYGRNNPLRYIDPDGMDITLGRCDLGSPEECFGRLQQGLRKDDRAHVRLIHGDGKNGFKKGEYGVAVDADYKSDSKNFQTLQKLANDHSATATIDVLNGDSSFDLKVSVRLDVRTAEDTFATMSTTPNEAGGFTGYTFYPQGKGVPGPYSPGNFTDVIVNASRGWIPATIHHELRHVLLGDFGRIAPYGAHGTGRVDRETIEAEKEAVSNQVEVLRRNPR
jgi:RHS repeat-associated protein